MLTGTKDQSPVAFSLVNRFVFWLRGNLLSLVRSMLNLGHRGHHEWGAH